MNRAEDTRQPPMLERADLRAKVVLPILGVLLLIVAVAALAACAGGESPTSPTPTPTPHTDDHDDDHEHPSPTAVPCPSTTSAAEPDPPSGASPDPSAPELEAINTSSYLDAGGTFHVLGEVRNNGSEDMEFVQVTGTFFDEAGATVASQFAFTLTDVVAPGHAEPFDIEVVDVAAPSIADFELAVEGSVAPEVPAITLTTLEDSGAVEGPGVFHVTGQVMNDGTEAYSFVQVTGTFYDSSGRVVAAEQAFSEPEIIAPGECVSFNLFVFDSETLGVTSYRLAVEGTPGAP